MNRDDLLKRCVDRRVAHETSVVAVSHLFYVYLLSALKKGQQVEVPNFGTFGTHMVGVKRQRRMPFFEVEEELADKVNERYRSLKTLLVGKYELVAAEEGIAYEGKEPRHDPMLDKAGREYVFDTDREITVDEFRDQVDRSQEPARTEQRPSEPTPIEPVRPVQVEQIYPEPPSAPTREPELAQQTQEKKLMPKLNLRGEDMTDETQPSDSAPEQPPMPPPTLRDISGGEGPSPFLQIVLGLLILAAITYALNHFGIIHLWGKKTTSPQVTEETLPPVVQPPSQTEEIPGGTPGQQEATPTPTPEIKEEVPPTTPAEEPAQPPAAEQKPEVKQPEPTPTRREPASVAAGKFTVQVSSWTKSADANRVVSRLNQSGFDAYIAEGFVRGRKWFRVRVGRYATSSDAQAAATKLKSINENGVWVTKVD